MGLVRQKIEAQYFILNTFWTIEVFPWDPDSGEPISTFRDNEIQYREKLLQFERLPV